MYKKEIIEKHLITEFERTIFTEALEILEKDEFKTRFTIFSLLIRELSSRVLHRLAPDDEVKKCSWFEQAPDTNITRRQRMLYAIKGGISDEFLEEELDLDIKDNVNEFKRSFDKLNQYTHITEDTFNIPIATSNEMAVRTLAALQSYFETIDSLRDSIKSSLEDPLYTEVSDNLIGDVIQDIDILATHYQIDDITLEEISIIEIKSDSILISGSGSVGVEHQYGSDRDFKKGDGARTEASYPFRLSTTSDVENPLQISLKSSDVEVDTSSHFE